MADIGLSFTKTCPLLDAIELELLGHIAAVSGAVKEIGQTIGINTEKADRLVTVCHAIELVREAESRIVEMNREAQTISATTWSTLCSGITSTARLSPTI